MHLSVYTHYDRRRPALPIHTAYYKYLCIPDICRLHAVHSHLLPCSCFFPPHGFLYHQSNTAAGNHRLLSDKPPLHRLCLPCNQLLCCRYILPLQKRLSYFCDTGQRRRLHPHSYCNMPHRLLLPCLHPMQNRNSYNRRRQKYLPAPE